MGGVGKGAEVVERAGWNVPEMGRGKARYVSGQGAEGGRWGGGCKSCSYDATGTEGGRGKEDTAALGLAEVGGRNGIRRRPRR